MHDTALIDPGKPWQNGATESFNGKFRDECLSLEWFRSRAEAKVVIESWRRHYKRGAPAFEPRLPHTGRVRAARTHVTCSRTASEYKADTRCTSSVHSG